MKLNYEVKREYSKNGKEALDKYINFIEEGHLYHFILMDI
jgi:hypothetical protein